MHFLDFVSGFAKTSASLFAIVDPIGVLPLFVTMVAGTDEKTVRRVVSVAAWTVFLALGAAALCGEAFLSLLGVRIPAFMVGGGLLLLLMSIPMMKASQSETRRTRAEEAEMESMHEAGAVPLGIPLLAGPAALSHVIIESHQNNDWVGICSLLLSIAVVALLSWAVLRAAKPISERLGAVGTGIALRVMGLVLAAVAVETMAKGFAGLFPKMFG